MGQFASAGPALRVPARKAAVSLMRVQSMVGGRVRPMPFVVAAA